MKAHTDQTQTAAPAARTAPFFQRTATEGFFSKAPALQRKPVLGKPNDAFEQEADRVADAVAEGRHAPTTSAGINALQRKCGNCEKEEKVQATFFTQTDSVQRQSKNDEKEEQEAIQANPATNGSAAVSDSFASQLSSSSGSGSTLPKAVQAKMSNHIGADFSNVRIHTNSQAAKMSQSIQAKAFTHGSDIYFNQGQYNPQSPEGQRLLAHELAHTVQQGSVQPMVQRDEEPVPAAAPTTQELLNASCAQSAFGLTWADFTGTPPSGSTYSAETHFETTASTHSGRDIIKATFLPSSSWVKSQFSQAAVRAQNSCSPPINACETFMQSEEDAGRTGATYNLSSPTGCAASIGPDTSLKATSKAQCESVLGAECDRVALLESARLLQHEQYHYALGCEIAKKGTLAIIGGSTAQAALTRVNTLVNEQTTLYDTETNHGCNAAQQTTWETSIDTGLPNVTF